MNDTLMDQCRREAEERYPLTVDGRPYASRRHEIDRDQVHCRLGYAAALYHERSKRPPTEAEKCRNNLIKHLEENPESAKRAWDEIAKKADDDYAEWYAALTPEQRAEILEQHAEYTLQKHFHTGPTLADLERMSLEHCIREVVAENERLSKRPPTVDGPPMITVEEAIAVLKPWIAKNSEDGEVLWHVLPEEKAEGITKYEADLRERLTAAATNNTNDNG